MNIIKKILYRVFVDALSGMTLGLFSTLVIGTILEQIGKLIGGSIGNYLVVMSYLPKVMTGAGIGIAVANKLKASPLVMFSAASAGMAGAYAGAIIRGTLFVNGTVVLTGPGESLGAFVAAYTAIEVGRLVSGKTKVDILVTPTITILSGSTMGLLIGPAISQMMTSLGAFINWSIELRPILMGIIVSVVMGMILTSPLSSAALAIILNLSGFAAGAATIGCTVNMVGFAVSSFRENGVGGIFAQGIGSSMLQLPNVMKKPVIWLPAILTSAILGPVATTLVPMTNNAIGAGMGASGCIGQLMTYQTMVENGASPAIVLLKILLMHIIAPAILSILISEIMRRKGLIKYGDLKLEI